VLLSGVNGEAVAIGSDYPFEKIAKISEARLSKAIFVFNRSKAVKANATICAHNADHFSFRKDCVGEAIVTYASARSDHHHTAIQAFRYEGESKILRERTRQNFDHRIDFQLIRRSLPGIDHAKLIHESFIPAVALNKKVLTDDLNICPQLPLGRLARQFDGVLGGLGSACCR
jgi:hypothetical protein